MTKRREPRSFADAVTRIAADLSYDEAGAVVGRSPSLLRKWADPDSGVVPSLDQGLALDTAYVIATGSAPPLLGAWQRQLEAAIAGRVERHEDPLCRFARAMKSVGTLGAELAAAKALGAVDLREQHKLVDLCNEVMGQLETLLIDIESATGVRVERLAGRRPKAV